MQISKTVLVVEDSETDREVYHRILQKHKGVTWKILEAEECEEALAHVEDEIIDVVLLDYSLPGYTGLEVLTKIRDINPYLAVVMLTGQGSEAVATDAMKRGAHDYLVKSDVTRESLLHAMFNAMDRVQMLHKIENQQADLRTFSAVLAHDIKSPVRAVKNLSDLALMSLQEGDIKVAIEMLTRIGNTTGHISELISDLEDYNKANADEVNFKVVSLSDVVTAALENLKAEIEENNAYVTSEWMPNVWGSHPQLVQLFQNLIGNGIKYCKGGSPSVHLKSVAKNGSVVISITDNGIGISQLNLKKIFEPFRRLHTEKAFPGTGLGLATCKKIVERHDGRIWCESSEGIGSTFHISMPAAAGV